ncbi:MAG: DUF5668 domain-containing protein [Bacteroidetes bacterium]|nr:DUF5668 domain-containing protein [Bacteroidota bacterium]
MRVSRLFAGLLIVVLGIALILSNFDVLRLDWHFIFRLWPVLLVFAGISILVPNPKWRAVFYAVTSVLVLAWIFSAASVGWGNVKGLFYGEKGSIHTQKFAQQFDKNIRHAVLTLNDGAGTFSIDGTTTDDLIQANAESNMGNYSFNTDKDGATQTVGLRFESGNGHWRFGGGKNTLNLKLNPNPDWEMDLNVGACKVDFDLTPFKVRSAEIKAGASKIEIRLGNEADTTRLTIDTGASSLVVYVPSSSGCQIKDQAELSTKSFPDFVKGEDGYYRTSNFSSAKKKVFLDVDAGVSSVKVMTY